MAHITSPVLDLRYKSKTEIPSSKTENGKSGSSCIAEDYNIFKIHKCIEKMITRPFSYNYFYETTFDGDDNGVIGDGYKRFLYFIDKHEEPLKSELTLLCYPIFVHLYLVLIRNSARSKAEKFFEDFSTLFERASGYRDVLKDLCNLKNTHDIVNHAYFKKFWEMKYALNLSNDTLRSLKLFLKDEKSKIMINVLRFHFYFGDLPVSPEFVNECNISSAYKNLASNSDMHDSDLIWKMEMSNVYISRIVVNCNIVNCSALDFNNDASQIAIAHSCPVISVANLEKKNILEPLEQNRIDSYTTGTMERISFPEPVYAVKYIPGATKNILVSSDTEIKMLNAETGDVILTFKASHTNSIVDIDINSSATLFATASKDNTSCLFCFKETKAVQKYVGHNDWINTVKFHPNGFYLATGSSDCTVKLYSIENSCVMRNFVGHETGVHCIAFSLDGKLLASADASTIKIWNINENCTISEMPFDTFEPLTRVSSLCFNFDASMLAACNYKGVLTIWSTKKCASQTPHTRLHFRNIPLLIKCNEKNVYIIVFKSSTE